MLDLEQLRTPANFDKIDPAKFAEMTREDSLDGFKDLEGGLRAGMTTFQNVRMTRVILGYLFLYQSMLAASPQS